MKTKVAVISYDFDKDRTYLDITSDFVAWDGILRADIMSDCLGLVDAEYTSALSAMRSDWTKIRHKAVTIPEEISEQNGNDAA